MGGDTPADVVSGIDAIWETVPHPVLVTDREGIVRSVSPSARVAIPDVTAGNVGQHVVSSWLSGARDRQAHPTDLPDGDVAWWLLEDDDSARRALDIARERSEFLDEASAVLMASLNIERCMEATVQMAARHLADAAVLVAPPSGGDLAVICGGADGTAEHRRVDADPAGVAGLAEALRGFPPVPSRWIDPDSVPEWLVPSDFSGPVGSVVITPLPGHGVPAGALILVRRTSHTAFSEGEEVFARLFAARAGAALSAARLYADQSAITRTLMQDLLPPRLHRRGGVEFAGGYRASADHEAIGGDFYDVHPASSPDGETLVVLGDVCGKGLDAAVLTGKIRNTLHALAPLAADHLDVLRLLNSTLLSVDDTRFATLVLASVSRRDSTVELRLTSAGHLAPLIVRNDGRVDEADTRGTLIGVLPEVKARTVPLTLAAGETCLLYTDGVTEARGGPLGSAIFGEDRLKAALAQCAGLPAEAVVERVMMLATQWVGDRPHDDIAVVAITAPRRTHLSAVDGHTAGRYTA